MSITQEIVGYTGRTFSHTLDERWSMAYAASLNDMSQSYFDNTDGKQVATHPVFPVCVEWPALAECLQENNIDMRNTVHATHDLHLLKTIHPTMALHTTATIIGVEQRKPGIYLGWRLDTTSTDGVLMSRTYQGNLFLGGILNGAPHWIEEMPSVDAHPKPLTTDGVAIHVPANLGQTYTECARIWNPIHSDLATARAAGLQQPLLHGTASLALAISAIVNELLGGEPARVKRVSGRFSSMVFMPSTLHVKTELDSSKIRFSLSNDSDLDVVWGGCIEYTQ
jgi:acyl dehydratase